MTFPEIIFSILMTGLIIAVLVSEYYARKARVVPMPSAPWMRKALLDVARQSTPDPKVIYELGAGWGTLALALAKQYPDAKITAYELSPVPFIFAKLRGVLGRHKNVQFKRADFLRQDLSKADLLIAYLVPPIMADLASKLNVEMGLGAHLVCHTFPIKGADTIALKTVHKMGYDLDVYAYAANAIKKVSTS